MNERNRTVTEAGGEGRTEQEAPWDSEGFPEPEERDFPERPGASLLDPEAPVNLTEEPVLEETAEIPAPAEEPEAKKKKPAPSAGKSGGSAGSGSRKKTPVPLPLPGADGAGKTARKKPREKTRSGTREKAGEASPSASRARVREKTGGEIPPDESSEAVDPAGTEARGEAREQAPRQVTILQNRLMGSYARAAGPAPGDGDPLFSLDPVERGLAARAEAGECLDRALSEEDFPAPGSPPAAFFPEQEGPRTPLSSTLDEGSLFQEEPVREAKEQAGSAAWQGTEAGRAAADPPWRSGGKTDQAPGVPLSPRAPDAAGPAPAEAAPGEESRSPGGSGVYPEGRSAREEELSREAGGKAFPTARETRRRRPGGRVRAVFVPAILLLVLALVSLVLVRQWLAPQAKPWPALPAAGGIAEREEASFRPAAELSLETQDPRTETLSPQGDPDEEAEAKAAADLLGLPEQADFSGRPSVRAGEEKKDFTDSGLPARPGDAHPETVGEQASGAAEIAARAGGDPGMALLSGRLAALEATGEALRGEISELREELRRARKDLSGLLAALAEGLASAKSAPLTGGKGSAASRSGLSETADASGRKAPAAPSAASDSSARGQTPGKTGRREKPGRPEKGARTDRPSFLEEAGWRVLGLSEGRAVLEDPRGRIRSLAVGESSEGFRVLSVDPEEGLVRTSRGSLAFSRETSSGRGSRRQP